MIEFLLEKWDDYWNAVTNGILALYDYFPTLSEQDLILIGSTLAAVACLNVVYHWMGKPKRWRARMTKEELRLFKNRELADAITDAVEDRVYKGIFTRGDANHYYFLIGHRCGLTDLFPKPPPKPLPPDPQKLKGEIRERLVNIFKTQKPLPKPSIPKAEGKTLKFGRSATSMQLKGATNVA